MSCGNDNSKKCANIIKFHVRQHLKFTVIIDRIVFVCKYICMVCRSQWGKVGGWGGGAVWLAEGAKYMLTSAVYTEPEKRPYPPGSICVNTIRILM